MDDYTPGEMRALILAALDAGLSASRSPGVRPLQPARAPRSVQSGSYSVVVSASLDTGIGLRDPGGSRSVVYLINVELIQKAGNPGNYPAALDSLYVFADEVFKALMSRGNTGEAFGCVVLEFVRMGQPTQGDASCFLGLQFTAKAGWPST